jgi:hypothetical protein
LRNFFDVLWALAYNSAMPTLFPGMDPYLERAGLWEDVHTALLVAIRAHLAPLLRPKYIVTVEQRVYQDLTLTALDGDELVGKPDILIVPEQPTARITTPTLPLEVTPVVAELLTSDELTERFLEIRRVGTNQVVTVIELLSPTNKRGAGRQEYLHKRASILASATHLVELDLLRGGKPMPMRLPATGDYRLLVSRAAQRPQADVFLFTLRQPIPSFPVPLLPADPEPTVPLNQLLHDLYTQVGYDLFIDYRRPLDPPLAAEDAQWAERLLAAAQT